MKDERTDEEVKKLALEFYKEDLKEMAKTENPPELIDANSYPMAAKIIADLEDDNGFDDDEVYEYLDDDEEGEE